VNGRYVVTGGAGFIGSHVVEALLARGADVHVIDDLSKGNVMNLPDGVPIHVADIASPAVGKVFEATRFDGVIHCAAQTNVMRSLSDPELDRRINVDGLRRVLEAAERSGVGRFVFISSGGAAYGETPTPATEVTPPMPDNPYGRHKVEGETIVNQARMSTISLRLSNVYGPRQRSDTEGGVISIFADRIAARLDLQVYGDGEQERDFVHVSDVVDAIALSLDDAVMTGVWNVGTGVATTVNRLAARMLRAFNSSCGVERLPERREIRRSCLDVSKLQGTGRWSAKVTLADGVAALATQLAGRGSAS
jgi:UDP-glucose 4-epimerase